MPRFLWLGLVVCALGVIAALLFVRALDAKDLVDPASAVPAATLPSEALELAPAEPTTDSAREFIDDARKVVAPPSIDRSQPAPRSRPRDVGPGHVVYTFDAGVVEVRVVRDHDGRPMAGVNVALDREDGPDVQTTDSSGVVVFTNVEGGRMEVSAVLAGHARAASDCSIARESPHASVELRLVVEREVVVRLQDPSGRTFEPAAWQLDRLAANRIGIRLDTRCGRMGSTFEAVDVIQFSSRSADKELGPFTWRLRIRGFPDVCVHALLDEVIVGVEALDARATELHIRLDPTAIDAALAPVLVRVLAEAGDVPVAGALVEFEGPGLRPPRFRTGIDGRVRVSMAAAPTNKLVVKAGGHAKARLTLTRPYPAEFVVRLRPGRRIAGRVVDQDGSPLAGAHVELHGAATDAAGRRPSMQSRKGGLFEFEDVAPEEYRVFATFSGNRVELLADCRAGDALGLEFKITVSKPALVPAAR